MTLLIIADSLDAHADEVEGELEALGVSWVRLNLDVPSLEATFLSYHSSSNHWCLSTPEWQVDGSNITAVWARRLSVDSVALESKESVDGVVRPEKDSVSSRMWLAEWNRSLHWLFYSLENRPWLPPFSKAVRASHKFLQFRVAREVGLDVPEFVLTNVRGKAQAFAEDWKEGVALKSLAQESYLLNGERVGLFVNKISHVDLSGMTETEENPLFLQRYVPKAYEVRVTSIAGQHLACRIESQRSERTSIDWRRYDIARTPHSVIELPSNVKQQLDALLQCLGLNFGASDFIVTEDGRWLFLEVNPNGQWLWIEGLTGLPIARTIAGYLAKLERDE